MYDPFTREFDRLVERAFGWGPSLWTQAGMPLDAVRRDNDILLRFDLPGVDPETIDVTTGRGVLTVRAQRSQEPESEKPFIRERVMGTFGRRIRFSDAADAEHIEADYRDGVLTIRVPLTEQAKPRKVEISTGSRNSHTA